MTPGSQDSQARSLYIDLLKKCLTRTLFPDGAYPGATLSPEEARQTLADPQFREAFDSGKIEVVLRKKQQPRQRDEGRDWPLEADTMIGAQRMDHLERCVTDILRRGVPGDLLEAGVWRGGATIFMRALLKAHGDTTRRVWVADSFQGLPRPDAERYPKDRGLDLWAFRELAVSLDEVKANFHKYGLLDEQVRFLPGWFRDTLPQAPVERLALLRLDGDLYESTILALEHLYPKLSPGGHVIIDDFHIEACRAAVEDFRVRQRVGAPLQHADWTGVSWQKEG